MKPDNKRGTNLLLKVKFNINTLRKFKSKTPIKNIHTKIFSKNSIYFGSSYGVKI